MLKIKTFCQLTIMRQDVINGGKKKSTPTQLCVGVSSTTSIENRIFSLNHPVHRCYHRYYYQPKTM